MNPDILINQEADIVNIYDIAEALYIDDLIEPYGKFKAKIDYTKIEQTHNAKLILVTAINPTPHGEGKTTTTIGLADSLNFLEKKTIACLREPALGPVFGKKGGATGGGYSQVAPMEDINLHFTGDFAAVASAHNLLAAMVDNHIWHGNALAIDKVTWRRVIDMNDRSLRDKFDIVVASEVMAILCLVESIEELKEKLGDITIGIDFEGNRVTARHLKAEGAMTALLKDAIKPNLVQTLFRNPVFIHGGPFANIAHGCNSVIATKTAMKIADYVVTEAGFGSDLGMEKFIDIKCRKAGIMPDAVVIVATVRALKHNGNGDLESGMSNLVAHIANVQNTFNLPSIVAINVFSDDTSEELQYIVDECSKFGVDAIRCTHWKNGVAGAVALAQAVIDMAQHNPLRPHFAYNEDINPMLKVQALANQIYGIKNVLFTLEVQNKLLAWHREFPTMPVCVSKTPVSLTADPTLLGRSYQHVAWVEDVELRSGAGFIVIKIGNVITLPGLPETPSAVGIDYIDGQIVGLS